MKLKYIIGILICLISLTGTALAADYSAVLDTCNEAGGENIQYVTASVSGNVITFKTTGLNSAPTGWFDVVGLPKGVSVDLVTDKYNTVVHSSDYEVKTDGTIDGFQYPGTSTKIIFTTADFTRSITSDDQDRFSEVHVTFSGTFDDPVEPIFGAHVAWGTAINNLKSAKYMGYGSSTTPIPEFPTIALPVAAIIGIMFIVGRKKE